MKALNLDSLYVEIAFVSIIFELFVGCFGDNISSYYICFFLFIISEDHGGNNNK
jgi:hypothetical protein